MVCIIISTQNGGTALLVAGWKGHSEVVKLLLGAGARDIPDEVDHSVTIMSVLMNHRVYVDTSVCQTYSRTFFKGKRSIPGGTLTNDTLFSSYGSAQQAVFNQMFCSFYQDK